jgi:hypothetical protein
VLVESGNPDRQGRQRFAFTAAPSSDRNQFLNLAIADAVIE